MKSLIPPGATLTHSFKLITEPHRYEVYDANNRLLGVVEFKSGEHNAGRNPWICEGIDGAFPGVIDAVAALVQNGNSLLAGGSGFSG